MKRGLGVVAVLFVLFGSFQPLSFAAETAVNLSAKALRECHEGRTAKARHIRLAHFERGQALAEKAVELDDKVADGHFALFCSLGEKMRVDGEFLSNVLEFRRMMAALDRTLALNPDHLDAISSKGTFLVKLPYLMGGDVEKGEEMLRRVIREDPTCINARLTLAEIYADRGNREGAMALATSALKYAKAQDRQDLIPEAEAAVAELQASDE